ncbi:tyrosine-type recombinase/integrase [Conexibacter sp. W3-3-2]|uniref:site-specific integrase n=1 Tax=Conexibacter sp. W3-3-2 TaxID=2675227 RepID=UPI0012B95014|nr:site-specific integrase [Conexibacter sp. W3-3-2]MTD47478.1 tyrosine-type recombinase/integrase [Conexibacter sp. W3-3-2]
MSGLQRRAENAALLAPIAGVSSDLSEALRLELADLADAARKYQAASISSNTIRAYNSDWEQFATWTARFGLDPLPAAPAVVALHLTALARSGRSVNTVRRRAAAIARAHRQGGHATPTADPDVLTVLEGIARQHGAPAKKKTALLRHPLLEIVSGIDVSTPAGLRDRALLLVGFALGLRRTELVSLLAEDLSSSPDGLFVQLPRSKTDQAGHGATLLLAYADSGNPCPVEALRAWIAHAKIVRGPIFRRLSKSGTVLGPLGDRSVALILKRRAGAVGKEPREFAGHSLRSGYATQAARDGHRTDVIAATTRHADQRTLAEYIHAGEGKAGTATVL